MAQMTGWPTDGADGSVSSEARWRAMARLWAPSGVVAGFGGDLAPTLGSGVINVAAGAAWVDGHYCELATPASEASTATGLLVVRFTPADNKFELVYRDGATTPTQTDATWELPIARMTGGVMADVRVLLAPGGSGMTRIGHRAGAAPQYDFTDIPATFQHLRLVASIRGDTASPATPTFVRFNNDGGATYDLQTNRGRSNVPSSAFTAGDNGARFAIPGAAAWSASYGPMTMDVPHYRGPGRRTFLVTYGWNSATTSIPSANDLTQEVVLGQWRNTNPITSLSVVPSAGGIAAGSVATLYGVF